MDIIAFIILIKGKETINVGVMYRPRYVMLNLQIT